MFYDETIYHTEDEIAILFLGLVKSLLLHLPGVTSSFKVGEITEAIRLDWVNKRSKSLAHGEANYTQNSRKDNQKDGVGFVARFPSAGYGRE